MGAADIIIGLRVILRCSWLLIVPAVGIVIFNVALEKRGKVKRKRLAGG